MRNRDGVTVQGFTKTIVRETLSYDIKNDLNFFRVGYSLRFFYIFSKILEKTRFSFDFLSDRVARLATSAKAPAKKIKGKPCFQDFFGKYRKIEDYPTRKK